MEKEEEDIKMPTYYLYHFIIFRKYVEQNLHMYPGTYIINTLTGRKVRLWQAILDFFAASAKNTDTHMLCLSCNDKKS
jgi:hypothetical protein